MMARRKNVWIWLICILLLTASAAGCAGSCRGKAENPSEPAPASEQPQNSGDEQITEDEIILVNPTDEKGDLPTLSPKTDAPGVMNTPIVTNTPSATDTPSATNAPSAANTPRATKTPGSTQDPLEIDIPDPTPTPTPKPGETAKPTETPTPASAGTPAASPTPNSSPIELPELP